MHQPPTNPFGDLPYQPGRQDEVVRAELVPEQVPDPRERISILYLMVWTGCTAVILTLYRQASQPADEPRILIASCLG